MLCYESNLYLLELREIHWLFFVLVDCPQCHLDLFSVSYTSCEGTLQLTEIPCFIPDLGRSIGIPEITRLDQENNEILTKFNLTFPVCQFFIQCLRVHLGCGVNVLALILFNNMVIKPNLIGVNASRMVKFRL